MRPLHLTLDGFRSYAARTEIDWRGSRLVGVVGPIGSGKSSLLDAIAFALFGMTPGERANTKALIHQRSDIAQVELLFSVEDQVWRSVRAIRRSGQSEHALYRYESDQAFRDGAKPTETVVKKGEVDLRIRGLLGMDFEAFGRSALLAQGRFAQLLKATPTQRDDVLKGVFGFDRIAAMERIAKSRRDDAARDLEELGRRSETFGDDQAALEFANAEALRAEKRWEQYADLAPVVEDLQERRLLHAQSLSACQTELETLRSVAARMPDAEESGDLLSRAGEGEQALAELDGQRAQLEVRQRDVEQREQEVLEEVGGAEALTEAEQLMLLLANQQQAYEKAVARNKAATAERDRVTKALEKAVADHDKAQANESEAAQALADGSEAVLAAQDRMHKAEHDDMAASLRAGLEVGHECPVCHQAVAALEQVDTESTVEIERVELAKALATQTRLQAAATEATERRAAAETLATSTNTQLGEATDREAAEITAVASAVTEMESSTGRLLELLGEGQPDVLLTEKKAAVAEARAELAAAAKRMQELQVMRDQHVLDAKAMASQLAALVSKLSDVAGRIDMDLTIGNEPDSVRNALNLIRETWKKRTQELTDRRHELEAQITEIDRLMGEKRASLDLEPELSWNEALADARVRVERARTERGLRQERVDAAGSLSDDIKDAEAALAVFTELAKELRPSRFLNYLLEEERAALAELGSHQLEDLTSGRYRFSDDGEFAIVDLTAAEQVRKSDTLSGGETFLASLALALALAEMMARAGGRIDAFFLDEGFGSLDPEHLDLALAGIERLVAADDNRLVVLVSHVPDMVDRLEDLITLDKDPITGATQVIV